MCHILFLVNSTDLDGGERMLSILFYFQLLCIFAIFLIKTRKKKKQNEDKVGEFF